jgi:hypothetical protein
MPKLTRHQQQSLIQAFNTAWATDFETPVGLQHFLLFFSFSWVA